MYPTFAKYPDRSNSCSYHICQGLLETLYRYGWGVMVNYLQEVGPSQLFSLMGGSSGGGLMDMWWEAMDLLKQVFEVIQFLPYGSYLMDQCRTLALQPTWCSCGRIPSWGQDQRWLIWLKNLGRAGHDYPRASYISGTTSPSSIHSLADFSVIDAEMDSSHTSSQQKAMSTQRSGVDLRVCASWLMLPSSPAAHACFWPHWHSGFILYHPRNVFIIGNHADELMPWVPVLARLHDAVGYIYILCCAWASKSDWQCWVCTAGVWWSVRHWGLRVQEIGRLLVCFCVFFSVLSCADGVHVSLSWKLGVIRPEWALDNVHAIVEDVTYYITYLDNLRLLST